MLKVGLTGGIASGKSTIGEMFVRRGAHLLQADHIAHELMAPGQQVYDAVVAHFGREILNPDGTINRPRLAAAAFPDRIRELNAIVHPAVIAWQDNWMEHIAHRDPSGVAIVEAALIYEAGADSHFDRMVVVTLAMDRKSARYAKRLGISLQEARVEVERRMAAQIPEEEKARRADYVIDNNGTVEATDQEVTDVWSRLLALATQ